MKDIHPLTCVKTSISMPAASYRRLSAARKIFARSGIRYADDEIYRRLFKEYLMNWRGRGRKTNGTRRYNTDGKNYVIRPLYINQVLYAALWQRALHSGESISRMLDVAIRVYLPRLLESLLSFPLMRNFRYWASRLRRRKRQYPDFFINYECQTLRNDGQVLIYSQNMKIIPKTNLAPLQILRL